MSTYTPILNFVRSASDLPPPPLPSVASRHFRAVVSRAEQHPRWRNPSQYIWEKRQNVEEQPPNPLVNFAGESLPDNLKAVEVTHITEHLVLEEVHQCVEVLVRPWDWSGQDRWGGTPYCMVIKSIFTKESPRQNRRDYLRQCVKLRLEAVRVLQEASLRLQNAPNVIANDSLEQSMGMEREVSSVISRNI